jgi:hypothetical protein
MTAGPWPAGDDGNLGADEAEDNGGEPVLATPVRLGFRNDELADCSTSVQQNFYCLIVGESFNVACADSTA